jgi:hypothetical protein
MLHPNPFNDVDGKRRLQGLSRDEYDTFPSVFKMYARPQVRGNANPEGMQTYHNFVRPTMVLRGKTPAEAAGIKVEGSNKRLTFIQNAAARKGGE